MLYSDWEHRDTQVTSELIRKGIEEHKINAELRAEIERLKQRTWVGLTEQQIKILLSDSKCWIGDDCSMPNVTYIIRAVEKAHGIGEK